MGHGFRAARLARQRASALILVLGVLVLLSIIGTAFVMLMRIELRAARNYVEDMEAQFLAKKALSYLLEHPAWNPPQTNITGMGVNNDNVGGVDSGFFTQPLAALTGTMPARYAVLKKPFAGRLNVNWDSFYISSGGANGIQALNSGASTGEISLEKAIAAYLNWLITDQGNPFGASPAESMDIAKEIAARIVQYRYGQGLGLPPTPPYPVFHGAAAAGVPATGVTNYPGTDVLDDTRFLDDTTLLFEPPVGIGGVPPAGRDADDASFWIGAATLPSVNWRPDPAADWVDQNGDGLADEANERRDEPQEFLQFLPNPPLASPPWPNNNDTPFGSGDLQAIVSNAGTPAIKLIVNDVLQTWVPAQGYSGYGGVLDYFNWMRPLFTTWNQDDVGDQTPINHLNLLMPAGATPVQISAVNADRTRFRATLAGALVAGKMTASEADLCAWQALANLIDYLDTDSTLTALARPDGWTTADDTNGNGMPDPGEPNTRTFYGTERQPCLNEFWIYNRYNDRFDNDNDGVVDDSNPLTDPMPLENANTSPPSTCGFYIELVNQYATPIVLYNNPAAPTDPTIDWRIRVIDASSGNVRIDIPMSQANVWIAGGWTQAYNNAQVVVPADFTNSRPGYLVIESTDQYTRADLPQPAADNVALNAAGMKRLPTPATMPAGSVLINLNLGSTNSTLFWPGDRVELVYSYDADGAGPGPADVAVVDLQNLPTDMGDKLSPGVGTRDFAPSYERQDPRLERCPRPAALPGSPATKELLYPTAGYINAGLSGGDAIRHTLGAVNDADDADADPFDGNYDLGKDSSGATRYDDLIEIADHPAAKFGNVGDLGSLLMVGPTLLSTSSWLPDSWVRRNSPYTAFADTGEDRPIDAKKVNFTDPAPSSSADPKGRAAAIFDMFTVSCPWRDGKDNDGDWNISVDDLDGDGGPTPGDAHVDESDERYVYGRVDINDPSTYGTLALAALPFVVYDANAANLPAYYIPPASVPDFYLTALGIAQQRGLLTGKRFESRKSFFDEVVLPRIDPATNLNFGCDKEDNHIFEFGATPRRWDVTRPWEWGTIQRVQRTKAINLNPTVGMFILPGQTDDGGDLLVDDKSEIDSTVGTLMNMIALRSELPEEFAQAGGIGLVTYYITVQITDGRDVDGVDDDGDGVGVSEPDWDEATVVAEKRIVALVDNSLPQSDPRRIQVFNWAVEGRYPDR